MALRNLLLHLPTLQICINAGCCTSEAWHLLLFNAETEPCPSVKHLPKESQILILLKYTKEYGRVSKFHTKRNFLNAQY